MAVTVRGSDILFPDGSTQTKAETCSQAQAGWCKLASGIIIQWNISQYISDYQVKTETFPIAFPSACTSVVTQNVDSQDQSWMDNMRVYNLTTTGFTMYRRGDNSRVWYIAIGY